MQAKAGSNTEPWYLPGLRETLKRGQEITVTVQGISQATSGTTFLDWLRKALKQNTNGHVASSSESFRLPATAATQTSSSLYEITQKASIGQSHPSPQMIDYLIQTLIDGLKNAYAKENVEVTTATDVSVILTPTHSQQPRMPQTHQRQGTHPKPVVYATPAGAPDATLPRIPAYTLHYSASQGVSPLTPRHRAPMTPGWVPSPVQDPPNHGGEAYNAALPVTAGARATLVRAPRASIPEQPGQPGRKKEWQTLLIAYIYDSRKPGICFLPTQGLFDPERIIIYEARDPQATLSPVVREQMIAYMGYAETELPKDVIRELENLEWTVSFTYVTPRTGQAVKPIAYCTRK